VKSAEFRLKNELGDYGVYQALASFSVTIQVIFAEESKMMRPYDVVG
jgi:hypothetical protein